VPTIKHPPKINAWAGIPARGKGKLFLFKENFDAALYKRVITDYMVPSLRALNGKHRSRLVVQQDSDPKHNAEVCLAPMGRAHITCLLQPPQSPDLNPLEDVWKVIKDAWRPTGPGPSRICSTGSGSSHITLCGCSHKCAPEMATEQSNAANGTNSGPVQLVGVILPGA